MGYGWLRLAQALSNVAQIYFLGDDMNRNIHDTSDIGKLFPIDSQTSDTDKLFLKNVINLMSEKFGSFTYIELGSFLGGTLAPFLVAKECISVP